MSVDWMPVDEKIWYHLIFRNEEKSFFFNQPPDSDSKTLMGQTVDWVMSKIRGIMGVEFADFGGIRRLSKINLVTTL
jgi:hypothetical protein